MNEGGKENKFELKRFMLDAGAMVESEYKDGGFYYGYVVDEYMIRMRRKMKQLNERVKELEDAIKKQIKHHETEHGNSSSGCVFLKDAMSVEKAEEITEPAWEAIQKYMKDSTNPLYHDFAKAIIWLWCRARDERSRIILLGERLDRLEEKAEEVEGI